jgi:hypothetical protein
MIDHNRSVVTIVDLLADLGGLIDFIVIALSLVIMPFNDKQLQTKAIRNIYFRFKKTFN